MGGAEPVSSGRKRSRLRVWLIRRSTSLRESYLGDGVYVAIDSQRGVVLTTENGLAVTNTIVLEPEIWEHLKAYVDNVEGV